MFKSFRTQLLASHVGLVLVVVAAVRLMRQNVQVLMDQAPQAAIGVQVLVLARFAFLFQLLLQLFQFAAQRLHVRPQRGDLVQQFDIALPAVGRRLLERSHAFGEAGTLGGHHGRGGRRGEEHEEKRGGDSHALSSRWLLVAGAWSSVAGAEFIRLFQQPTTDNRLGHLAVYTISTRRFCDQQPSLDSVQTGRSSP